MSSLDSHDQDDVLVRDVDGIDDLAVCVSLEDQQVTFLLRLPSPAPSLSHQIADFDSLPPKSSPLPSPPAVGQRLLSLLLLDYYSGDTGQNFEGQDWGIED
ncbi:unnamed protein product [Linum trigynum]|uniref:Uncharacterized protein n=1 Tax=Linum trigynum TaxID=586398 RepID=A0AAV2GR64_9ROSI